jgi:RNA polymerase sigma-70 factor (ECF subfamily)
VARWILGVPARPESAGVAAAAEINGSPGVLFTLAGRPAGALTFEVAGGRMGELRFQADPDEPGGLEPRTGPGRPDGDRSPRT